MTNRLKILVSVLILTASVATTYMNSLYGVFVFDDIPVILSNASITGHLPMPIDSRLLCNLSFKSNILIFGTSRFPFHAVNIFIHILASIFLFLTIKTTLDLRRGIAPNLSDRLIIAFSAALIWGAHPLTTQSVTYICQRYESMAGMFLLASLYFFARSLQTHSRTRLNANLSLLACLLGMSCKEVMITAPAIILLYDYTFSGDSFRIMWQKRKYYYLCLILLTAGLLLLWLGTLSRTWNLGMVVTTTTSGNNYLINQSDVICKYIAKAIYPAGLRFVSNPEIMPITALLPSLLTITSLLLSSIVLAMKRHPAGFAMFSFFILLAPTSSFIPLPDLYAEQRMYLPLALIISTVIATAFHFAAPYYKYKIVLISLIAFATITLAVTTHIRNHDYYTELTLWESVTKVEPLNARAHLGIGTAYYGMKRPCEAEASFKNVLIILKNKDNATKSGQRTEYISALNNLGTIEFSRGRYEDAAKYFKEAIHIAPLYKDAVRNLTVCEETAKRNQHKTEH